MSQQNLKNHSRIWPIYHFYTFGAILALLGGAIANIATSEPSNRYSAWLILLISVIFISLFFLARVMSLKAQDRAIRAEENLRHYILSGRPLDSSLRISQIIALRFAPDEEFVELAKQAAAEKMGNKRIKQAIQQWKADHHRV